MFKNSLMPPKFYNADITNQLYNLLNKIYFKSQKNCLIKYEISNVYV